MTTADADDAAAAAAAFVRSADTLLRERGRERGKKGGSRSEEGDEGGGIVGEV